MLNKLSPGLKNIVLLLLCNGIGVLAFWLLWPARPWVFLAVIVGVVFLAVAGLYRGVLRQDALLNKLRAGLMNMNDGNLAVTLPEHEDDLGTGILPLFNRVADRLRRERQHLYQRELLLDKVMNSTTLITVLVDHRERVVFYNQAAKDFFQSTEMGGADWAKLRPPQLAQEMAGRGSAICTLADSDGTPGFWAVSCSDISLHGMPHQLFLFKPMSEELSRQELATWKKAIRVVSHELNNSIAPISSLCHSGQLLAERLDEPRLDRVFSGIAGRVQHLSAFVKAYAQMAKLTTPQKTQVDIKALLNGLHELYPFVADFPQHSISLNADPTQIEQLLINILTNAHQAAPDKPVTVILQETGRQLVIRVQDEGPGIEPALLANVLLPFYSTRTNGSGMGLAICRDIIEAHGGELTLQNRPQGGLSVDVVLPNRAQSVGNH